MFQSIVIFKGQYLFSFDKVKCNIVKPQADTLIARSLIKSFYLTQSVSLTPGAPIDNEATKLL